MKKLKYIKISLSPFLLMVALFFGTTVAHAVLTTSSSDTPEKIKYKDSCYKTAVAALQAELSAKKIDIFGFEAKRSDAYNRCANEARAMDVPEKGKAAPAPAPKNSCYEDCFANKYQYAPENQRGPFCNYDCGHSVVTPTVSTPTTEVLNDAGKKYQDRYVAKCMDAYKNNPNASACCSALAVEDTKTMQKKGVFDTATTAEIPIIVDEAKCKAKEYKYSCVGKYSVTDSNGSDSSCNEYINRCIEAGKFAYQSDKGKIEACELDYVMKRPIKLGTLEKYVNICLKSRAGDSEDAESQKGACMADFYGAVREYRDRCVASLSKVDYNPFNNWVIRIRGMFGPEAYKAKALECVKRYDQALDNMLADLNK